MTGEDPSIRARIEKMRSLLPQSRDLSAIKEAAVLGQSVLHDTVGDSHPAMKVLDQGLEMTDYSAVAPIQAGCRTIFMLYETGGLESPRLRIAREMEGDVLDIAEAQAMAAEATTDPGRKQIRLAIAAFLAGAALEDALRRLCDRH